MTMCVSVYTTYVHMYICKFHVNICTVQHKEIIGLTFENIKETRQYCHDDSGPILTTLTMIGSGQFY